VTWKRIICLGLIEIHHLPSFVFPTWVIWSIKKSNSVEMFGGGETHRHELSDSLVKTIVGSSPVK
jgi:hypothetical protein